MTSIYDILRRPILTEKSSHQYAKLNQYAFEVAKNANKSMIKEAVEDIFDVKVLRVNTMIMPAKRSRRAQSRRVLVRKSAYKKAIVTLAPGDTIAIFEGVR
ncbi:MAG TPA: 50S ribosomal protein L23 [Chloroflexi bacterium]|nr:MAG: 50S ribosomal protein L23 [Chloroflexota bacterium]HDD55747.1 50S ribosomal protein L23 [Chloroflexota bacterium]